MTNISTAMKRCLNQEKNMKSTKVLLLGAVATALTFTSFAAEPLLSPRAAGNQARVFTSSIVTQGGTITYIVSAPALLSPCAQSGQMKIVKGMTSDVNPSLACRSGMTGSPKAVTECTSHTTMPGCVTVAPLK